MLSPNTIFGNYTIIGLIGQGGMGTVYRASDTSHDREVALKLLNEDLAASATYREKLASEARHTALVDSPYVASVWETGEVDGHPYIAMEHVAGPDLRAAAKELSTEQKLDIAIMIAQGIDAAHQQGLVHRDLKPENIRLTEDNIPKILDFGLAHELDPDQVDEKGNIEGTIMYSSPEQLSGEPITPSADLFSFGVVLYELFTDRLPFESDYSAGIVYSVLYEDPVSPQEVCPELPEWLCDAIVHLLQKQAADRPANTRAFLDSIERNVREGTPGATAVGISRRRKAVTVIDLKNLSGDASWDYFSQGFTEEVVSELRRRTDLTVTAQPPTAVPTDIATVFERCRTDFVITGSLMRWQKRIRMSLDIYADRGDTVVSNRRYEGATDELFELLSRAAGATAQTLADVTATSSVDAEHGITPDVTAYDFYLKGRNYYQTSRPADLRFAEDMFNRALQIDANYALAYAGLSDVHVVQYMFYYDRSPERARAARQAAQRAIELDPQLPEAHRAMGRYYMLRSETDLAEASFRQAVALNPKYAIGYRTLAWLKMMAGDLDATQELAQRALRLAPTDLETLLLISLVHMDRRKFTLAVATLQRAIELGPDYGRAYYCLGEVYLKLGVPEVALENMLEAIRYQGDPNVYCLAGYLYMVLGRHDEARRKFREAVEAGQLAFIALFYLGALDKADGKTAEADALFQQALRSIDEHDGGESPSIHLNAYRALILAFNGEEQSARELLEKLEIDQTHDAEVHQCMSRAYAALGDAERAARSIQDSMEHHDGPTEKEIQLDPLLAAVR